MNNFWLCIGDNDDAGGFDHEGDTAYKKFEGWPCIPRVGEWVEYHKGWCGHVVEIWHKMHDGVPATFVYAKISGSENDQDDVQSMIKLHGWAAEPPASSDK